MGKKPKNPRSHKIVVEIAEKRYKRWKILDKNRRILLIDFRCIRNSPVKPIDYGARRRMLWRSPEQLKGMIDGYFDSCFGPVRNPKGGFYENPDGSLVIGQIKPFTVSGLCLYCHMATKQLFTYSRAQLDALGKPTDEDYVGPQYSDLLIEAKRKIQNYAEERLYDRDGFNGGRFVLDTAFKWVSQRESAEIKALKEQNKLKKKELKFKKQQAALGEVTEEPINITIRRAGTSE